MQFKKNRYMGLSLGGGKTKKTHLAVLDYYPKEKKIFLSQLVKDICEDVEVTSDTTLIQIFRELSEDLKLITVDAPLTVPKCLRCKLSCPGLEDCKEPEILWMWKRYKQRAKKKRPNKIFSGYSERCMEYVLAEDLEHKFNIDHAFGSNKAPQYARMEFLKKRLKKVKLLETLPRVNVWRLGREMKINKAVLNFYKHPVDGEENRSIIVEHLLNKEWMFIYRQDAKAMVKDAFVFEAVISGFVAFLQQRKATEKKPKDLPNGAPWPVVPSRGFSDFL